MNILLDKIIDKTAVLGVVGLGYVGLPLAVEKAKAGFNTIGFDIQMEKVDMVNRGINYIGDVVNEDLQQFIGEYTKQIDLTNNAKGIYFLEIETIDGVINKKLVLQ